MTASPNRRATAWLLAMALLLQGLVALAHHPAFRLGERAAFADLVSICTPDGWKSADHTKPPADTSPAAELCALCQTLQPVSVEPPAVALPIPARAYVLVSAASPPGPPLAAAPDPSQHQPRAPPFAA